MRDSQTVFDVVQIGYGPVSEVMALALARQGRRVAVVERWTDRYPLPRAVCVDHEIFRVLSALGLADRLASVSHGGPMYRWFNEDWKELLAIDWQSESISGGAEVNFVHQPTLEAMIEEYVKQYPNVDLHLGWEAVAFSQFDDFVDVTLRNPGTGETRSLRAKYVIGADGANSLVRREIGSEQEDRGFEADWLVIDVLPHEGVELDIPPAAQYCNPARPTTIVPGGVKDGRFFRRWEFMRLPHETREDIEHEHVAWELLRPWVRPGQATIVRHKVYTFRSLLAQTWRKGRLLIAGDAAHVMPPFMGQGMCSGLRDAWNLAWKLGLVLDGKAGQELLDTYQVERHPHVSDVIDLSMFLGKIICIPDHRQAAERDEAFFSGRVPPPAPFPFLVDGMLRRDQTGGVATPAGRLSPHGRVRSGDRVGRFDQIVGIGFVLIIRGAFDEAALDSDHKAFVEELGVKVVSIASTGDTSGPEVLVDLDDKFVPFMASLGVQAMLVRPDFYLYGAAQERSDIAPLIQDLRRDFERYGVAHPAAACA